MPAWLAAAVALLARGGGAARTALVGGPGRALVTGTGVGSLLGGGIPFVDLFPDGTDGTKKRRRRRRALTASDRADIGFITGLLGTAAGKSFAMVVASRTSF